jgi:glutathione S-transferase
VKLYYSPLTSAFRPRWVLEETGQEHELVRLSLSPADLKSPEYLAIHPLGHVPALVDGDIVLIESAAICMYLAERDPAKTLLPTESATARAYYYQWIFYAMETLAPVVHPVYLRWFLAPPEQKAQVASEKDHAAAQRVMAPLEAIVASGPYLLGERISTADIILGGVLQWAEASGLLKNSPALEQYHARLSARPAYRRAYAD